MSPTYRPEIDGLRAVAVLAIVLFHAEFLLLGVNPFQGGYIGVDVFFVISGYLITSIILRELQAGSFSFASFYERRARRILPALLTVMLVSLPFAWLLMLPKAVKEYAGSLLSSLAFGSNIWFWLEDSYWAEPSEYKPFLHTWSLSVEEQFYIAFPVFLLLLWKTGRRFVGPPLIVVFLGSLLLAQFGSATHAEATFYLAFTRAWELMAGAILANLEMTRGRTSNPLLEKIMPALGIVLVCGAVILFNDVVPHPSFVTLIPVVGTMLLIWFCREGDLVSRILSSRPFVAIGLISYSFYLWHFPIFVFARITDASPSQVDKLVQMLAALILSLLSYFLVEKTFRNRTLLKRQAFVSTILISTATVFSVSAVVFNSDGLWGRYSAGQLQMLGIGEGKQPFTDYVLAYTKGTWARTEFVDADEKNDVFVIGDSYAGDFLNALNESGFLQGLEVLSHKISWDCQNVPMTSDYQTFIKPKAVDKCRDTVRVGHQSLRQRIVDAELILFVSSWTEYATSQFDELLAAIKRQTDAPVLIVGRKHFGKMDFKALLELRQDELIDTRQESKRHLASIAMVPESVKPNYLDLHQLFCGDDPSCPIATPEGFLISYDGGHLTREGALHLADLLSKNEEFMSLWRKIFGRYSCQEPGNPGGFCYSN